MNRTPHILFIVVDDHQSACLGTHGNKIIQTPVIDRLAAEGCDFQRAYIMGGCDPAVCVPSRAAFLTARNPLVAVGLDPTQISVGTATVNPHLPLMPEWFRKAGWHTHGVGKWHNGKASYARCFDSGGAIFFGGMCDHDAVPIHDFDLTGEYAPETSRINSGKFSSELFCDEAIAFIKQRSKNQNDSPFFLYLALTSPHDPRTPPSPYATMYSPSKIPLPENFLPKHPFDNGELDIRDELLLPTPREPQAIQKDLADYYGMISHHDHQVGRVMAALEASGTIDNTLIVYMSDHGVALGRHGLLGKQNLYEHSVVIPLILRGPGVTKNQAITSLVHSFDIFPTLCELTRIALPTHLDGKSMTPLFGQSSTPTRGEVFAFYRDFQSMVIHGDWKLIEYTINGLSRHQLFNLARDPFELADQSGTPEYRSTLSDMQQRLVRCKTSLPFDDPASYA